jgi:hypothetical protein
MNVFRAGSSKQMAQAFTILVAVLKAIEIGLLVLVICKNANKKFVLFIAVLVSHSCAGNDHYFALSSSFKENSEHLNVKRSEISCTLNVFVERIEQTTNAV